MAVRLPRGWRTIRRRGRHRDLIISIIVATAFVVFGMRLVMAALAVQTWTLGWRVIDLPSAPFVAPLLRIQALHSTPIGRLTVADVLVALLAGILGLLLLASLANRRVS